MTMTRNLTGTTFFEDDAGRFVPCWKGSGNKPVSTPTVVIKATPGILHGVLAHGDGTNEAVVTVYDNATEGSGTVIASYKVIAGEKVGGIIGLDVHGENGITITMSGTGASAEVFYL